MRDRWLYRSSADQPSPPRLAPIAALLVSCLLALSASADWRTQPVTTTVGELEFRDCSLRNPVQRRLAQCATLIVPENHEQPQGRQIELFVARLPARSPAREPDPVLAIAGGPGQAASESFLHLDRMLPGLSRNRDIYLLDQRGTGGSNAQHCDIDDAQALMMEPDDEQWQELMQQCLQQFDGDPAHYSSSAAIHDIEHLRLALNVGQWNLFSVSYGTRVAQHYARQYSQAVRSSVLDSVLPPGMALGPNIAPASQQALENFLQRCRSDRACAAAYPELDTGLRRLLNDLQEAPVEVEIEHADNLQRVTRLFTRTQLAGLLRLALYSPEQLSILPPMLHAAYAQENFAPLARSATHLLEQVGSGLAIGMHNAVVCTEDVPFFALDESVLEANSASYLGDTILRSLLASCEIWPAGTLDDNFHTPLQSDIPTLLLSGEHDPITPPAYADQAMQGLSRSRHLVAPGQGHSVSPHGCLPRLIAEFVDSTDPGAIDDSCLQRLRAAPLFTDFHGPEP